MKKRPSIAEQLVEHKIPDVGVYVSGLLILTKACAKRCGVSTTVTGKSKNMMSWVVDSDPTRKAEYQKVRKLAIKLGREEALPTVEILDGHPDRGGLVLELVICRNAAARVSVRRQSKRLFGGRKDGV